MRTHALTDQFTITQLVRCATAVLLSVAVGMATEANAQHQTPSFTPLSPASELPYRVEVREYQYSGGTLPTLHSYARAEYDGKWLLIAGRTNGVHGFENPGFDNFPAESQNKDVWVIDPATGQSWSRALDDGASGLNEAEALSLSPTNNQFYQSGDRLYMTGGYGFNGAGGLGTHDALTAIDVPEMMDWVVNGAGTAKDALRQIHDDLFKVTGGAMYEVDGRTHIVFGQDFDGVYSPFSNGAYTRQVRSFDIVDDGTSLSVENISSTSPTFAYRRRDLNVFPTVSDNGGSLENGLTALSGVFTVTNGVWTVPVEIAADGTPSMGDPNAAETFKQGFNQYHSAKLGLFSETTGSMHEVLFGGISVMYVDQSSGTPLQDNNVPFVNDITSVVVDYDGNYSQHHLGFFPELTDATGALLRFGANAEFFTDAGIETYGNGVIKLDAITGETRLGYIFGGLMTNGPHTQQGADSAASNRIFEVVLLPVPEPSSIVLAAAGATASLAAACRRRRT
ncbi:MAG: PEP-CTERM sorting domain-containing protein [Planctomycetales bacterium]|nr:PEP-CTERM sorting domain-containing protein [Planctomycetales bacterium]